MSMDIHKALRMPFTLIMVYDLFQNGLMVSRVDPGRKGSIRSRSGTSASPRSIYKNYDFKTFVLVASVRHPQHGVEAALAGGHICTWPCAIFQQPVKHPLTDLGMKRFLADWHVQFQKSPTVREGIPI